MSSKFKKKSSSSFIMLYILPAGYHIAGFRHKDDTPNIDTVHIIYNFKKENLELLHSHK